MKTKVRAVFEVTKNSPGDDEVTFECVYDAPEWEEFFEATPWGEIYMSISDPETRALLEPGKKFYVDFHPVSEDS